MDSTIVVSLITLIGVIITSVLSFFAMRKESADNFKLFIYRVEQLEKKVEKHNSVVDRIYKLEKNQDVMDEQIKVANHRIDDLEKYTD